MENTGHTGHGLKNRRRNHGNLSEVLNFILVNDLSKRNTTEILKKCKNKAFYN